MPRRIVALTPNPAIDRTLTLGERLEPGTLHRVRRVREAAGGKGVNLVRAVVAMGGEALVAGPLAGRGGRTFRELLARDGLTGAMTEVVGETRQCTILLDGGDHPTEINEPGPEVSEEQWRALLEGLPEGRVVVSGSLPPGTAPERFGALLGALPGPLTVDGHGPALLAALEAGAELIAPNVRELAELAAALGMTAGSDAGSAVAASPAPSAEPRAAGPAGRDGFRRPIGPDLGHALGVAAAVRRRFGARVLVTLGEAGAALVGERTWLAHAPAIDAVNPIGSGDCLLGTFLWAEEAGLPADEALALGVAAGTDNARRGGGGTLEGASVRELARRVRREALGPQDPGRENLP